MLKILMIDDDKDLQEATRIVLEKHNFEFASAYDPEEGLKKVQSEKPDLVILDVLMPSDYEGFKVARDIREKLNMRKLPIILLTAYNFFIKNFIPPCRPPAIHRAGLESRFYRETCERLHIFL